MVFSSVFACWFGSAVWIARLALGLRPADSGLKGPGFGSGVGYRYGQDTGKFALLPVSDRRRGNVSGGAMAGARFLHVHAPEKMKVESTSRKEAPYAQDPDTRRRPYPLPRLAAPRGRGVRLHLLPAQPECQLHHPHQFPDRLHGLLPKLLR